jgi:hypothetical protein
MRFLLNTIRFGVKDTFCCPLFIRQTARPFLYKPWNWKKCQICFSNWNPYTFFREEIKIFQSFFLIRIPVRKLTGGAVCYILNKLTSVSRRQFWEEKNGEILHRFLMLRGLSKTINSSFRLTRDWLIHPHVDKRLVALCGNFLTVVRPIGLRLCSCLQQPTNHHRRSRVTVWLEPTGEDNLKTGQNLMENFVKSSSRLFF